MRRMLRTIGSQRCRDEVVCVMANENLESSRRRQAWGEGLRTYGRALAELGFDLEKPPVSTQISDVTAIGLMLFRYFNLPFQIVGVLLLVATVGVVVLSRRELK